MTRPSFPIVTGLPWPGVRYFCTTRAGGVSVGAWESFNLAQHVEDDHGHVAENRRRLLAALPSPPIGLRQVHGTQVVDAAAGLPSEALPEADAAITSNPLQVLCIQTADCLPVVLADTQGAVLGVAHAGWRGLAGGVLEATLAAMRAKRNDPDMSIRAWIGPGISQRHFEVGQEVYHAFVDRDPEEERYFVRHPSKEKWHADLPGLARHRLWSAGVRHIELSGWCTYTQEDMFFSYRRSPQTGRMATVAWLDPAST